MDCGRNKLEISSIGRVAVSKTVGCRFESCISSMNYKVKTSSRTTKAEAATPTGVEIVQKSVFKKKICNSSFGEVLLIQETDPKSGRMAEWIQVPNVGPGLKAWKHIARHQFGKKRLILRENGQTIPY